MSQSIISRGKTVKEAVTVGLELLNASKKDVNIEILKFETKGIMGFGKKKAVVKLTMESVPNEKVVSNADNLTTENFLKMFENELEGFHSNEPGEVITRGSDTKEVENQLSGKAWVKNGEIYCQPSPTNYPTVTVGNELKLLKNNKLVQQTSLIISEKDKLRLDIKNEEVKTNWKVNVEDEGLKAVLRIEPGYTLTKVLDDADPTDHLKLSVSEHRSIHNSLTYEGIMERLRNLRIIYGINQGEILKAIEATEPGEFVIAMGKQASPGKNGQIEYRVDFELKREPLSREDGSINFREIKNIPNCSNGQVIAVIHAPKPGVPGVKITNEPLPPRQVSPIILHDCKGIMQIENGTEIHVVATESGRPFIQKRGQIVKIAIMPKMLCRGNVNLEYGNIRFHGDVEITGDVNEMMEVEAKGNIIVHKNVYKASINSTGTILTNGNIIGSELSSGKSNLLIAEMGYSLGVINSQIKSIINVINELKKSPAFKSSDFAKKGLQPLVFILLERKFKNFTSLIKNYIGIVDKNEKSLDYEWKETSIILKECFLSINNELLKLERLYYLTEKIDSLIKFSEIPVEPDSHIVIPYAMNSKVYCSGNISITGQGCYNTKVHSGGFLQIDGVVRGGELYGRMGVKINETGSDSGVNTLISVPINQKVVINQAKEGTIIKIGKFKHIINEDMYNVYARVIEDRLII